MPDAPPMPQAPTTEAPVPDISVLRALPGARIATPLCHLAQEVASLRGWRRYGMGFLLGVLLAGAMPPVDLTPLVFIVFPLLMWLDEGSVGAWASARLGYVFGLGFFVAGLYWVAAALFVDIARFWWVLPFAVFGLPALLACFTAAALGLTGLAAKRLSLAPSARVCLFAVLWSAAEWARGHVLTGFPWNLVGYAWSGGFPGALTMLQTTAWVGIYGLSLVTVLAASLLALLGTSSLRPVTRAQRALPPVVAALLILLPAGLGIWRLNALTSRASDTWVRLVQPSIPEAAKWDPARAQSNFQRMLDLSRAASPHRLAAVLWPEAASPYFLGRDTAARLLVAAVAPNGGYVITGTLRATPPGTSPVQVWNSVEAIDAAGLIRGRYDKAHLVPFGEYVPFRDVMPLAKLTPGAIDLSAGPGPQTMILPGLPALSPTVCYEAIFPGAVVNERERPRWILNVTNDSWYGRTSGPYQHFAIARTRAIEEGLPLVRVANNGISGVIGPAGRIVGRTALNDITYMDAALPMPAPPTLYERIGDWGFLAMLGLVLIPAVRRRA